MYNNIDTEHAINVISWWLNDLYTKGLLPKGFPLKAVKNAMVIIMKDNVFKFGDLHFLQLIGTAMGKSVAVMWATIYFAHHKSHRIVSKHGKHLLYYCCFIDNIHDIWIGNCTNEWDAFYNNLNDFEILTWNVEQLLHT